MASPPDGSGRSDTGARPGSRAPAAISTVVVLLSLVGIVLIIWGVIVDSTTLQTSGKIAVVVGLLVLAPVLWRHRRGNRGNR